MEVAAIKGCGVAVVVCWPAVVTVGRRTGVELLMFIVDPPVDTTALLTPLLLIIRLFFCSGPSSSELLTRGGGPLIVTMADELACCKRKWRDGEHIHTIHTSIVFTIADGGIAMADILMESSFSC